MTRTPKQYLDDSNLTDEVLRDLARNESASKPMRKEATRLLLSRRSPHAKHEDLREFVAEIKGEAEAHQEVVAIVESATEAPFPAPDPDADKTLMAGDILKYVEAQKGAQKPENPALKASFTTASF